MDKKLPGLTRPVYLSRIGKAASLSVSPHSFDQTHSPTKAKLRRRPVALMAVFRSVSRRRAERTGKSKTDSPDVGTYHPNYNVGKLRTDHGPLYREECTEPRAQRIYLPACLTDIEATYPRHSRHPESYRSNSCFDQARKRLVQDLSIFSQTIDAKVSGETYSSPQTRLKGLVSIDHQLIRPIFVPQPPSAHYFNSAESSPLSMRAPPDFNKSLDRPELFTPRPLPDYRPITRLIRRGSPQALAFRKRPGRKSLALEHILRNPPQVNQLNIDRGWAAVQNTRPKAPLLALISPRDDLMYRTSETYKQNVPRKQLATEVPSYQGDFKEAMQKGSADITIYL